MSSEDAQKRHQMMSDGDFWLRLEFELSGWLSGSGDSVHRRYWIDGFIPQTISNTRYGADVSGEVWVAQDKTQQKFCFSLRVPQPLLYLPSARHEVSDVQIDECKRHIQITLVEARTV